MMPDEAESTDEGQDGAHAKSAEPGHPGRSEQAKPDRSDRADARESSQPPDGTGDPLDSPFDGTVGASADQAYRTWVRNIRSAGSTAIVGGGIFRDLSIGGTTLYLHDRREQSPGRVRPEALAELVERYAPIACYDKLVKRLREARLVVLRGTPGTGRAATGLRMLAEVAHGKVSRFDPDTDLRSLNDSELEPDSGYLIELTPGRSGGAPAAMHIDRLRDLLAARQSFMVLITPHDSRYRVSFDDYIIECPPPDPQLVLQNAVDFQARERPDLAPALRRLAADPRLHDAHTPQLPSEALWLARLMTSLAADETRSDERKIDELRARSGESLSRHVSEWFDPLANLPTSAEADDMVRLGAFRIALAVFNETPFDAVAEAGERLALSLLTTVSPRRTPGRRVFASHRDDYVADSHARLVASIVNLTDEAVPATLAAYMDERLPGAVLRHVWNVHNARGPIISWLQSLCHDQRPFVWMRAALAIGLLSSWDFSYTFHEVFVPWANSPDIEPNNQRRRMVAAVALDAASRNSDVAAAVSEILDDWCHKGTKAQRWTGTAALGYDLALRDIPKSLRYLRSVSSWENGALRQIASWAVARIFTHGGITPVVKALGDWLHDDRLLVRNLGQTTVIRIAGFTVANAEDIDLMTASNEKAWTRLANWRHWPLLVALVTEDPSLLDPVADLVWQLTRSAQVSGKLVHDFLAKWMRAAAKDPACAWPVGRFLALLGDDESDRARLLHLVDVLRSDPDDPLPADTAEQFARIIRVGIGMAAQ